MICVALDFETTGLSPDSSEIIEIGAVKFNLSNGAILDEFNSLVRPEHGIPDRITNLTGIDYGMVARELAIEEVWRRFESWLGECRFIVAHNASFEMKFINSISPHLSIDYFHVIDTLKLARLYIDNVPNYKLLTLRPELEGLAHRALPDAYACASLLLEIASDNNLDCNDEKLRALKPVKRKIKPRDKSAAVRDAEDNPVANEMKPYLQVLQLKDDIKIAVETDIVNNLDNVVSQHLSTIDERLNKMRTREQSLEQEVIEMTGRIDELADKIFVQQIVVVVVAVISALALLISLVF